MKRTGFGPGETDLPGPRELNTGAGYRQAGPGGPGIFLKLCVRLRPRLEIKFLGETPGPPGPSGLKPILARVSLDRESLFHPVQTRSAQAAASKAYRDTAQPLASAIIGLAALPAWKRRCSTVPWFSRKMRFFRESCMK